MKIIIPMAGNGKKMRPHTLTIPKGLIPIAGKPIVQRLIAEIGKNSKSQIEEIVFIIGQFGKEIEKRLRKIAKDLDAKPVIYYQKRALGTAHAIYCAKDSLKGKIIVAFADTLFKAKFVLNEKDDGIIWIKKVDDQGSFGVVKINENNVVKEFIEKPEKFVSDKTIIGIYYFKDGDILKRQLKYLIDYNVMVGTEYQLTTALENMKNDGIRFITKEVNEWLDCGSKNATVYANKRILNNIKSKNLISARAKINNSVIINPSFIDDNVKIINSIVGPYISIGKNSLVENSLLKNSIIQSNSILRDININNSIIGNYVDVNGTVNEVNIGDYTSIYK